MAAARVQAARAVMAVMQGRSLDQLSFGERDDTALVRELAYGTLRWYHRLRALLMLMMERPLKDKDADLTALLLIGLYQLIYMRVPAHAAVSETVAATVSLGKPWARGLVNAVLRRVGREQDELEARLDSPEAITSHPAWLLDLLTAAWPQDWQTIIDANNSRPPMAIRVNLLRSSRAQYLGRLDQAGIPARAVDTGDAALVLEQPVPVTRLPGFADGEVSVQDLSAQLAAVITDPQPGDYVLDACAAPGGKTAHLLERSRAAEVVAVEVDGDRVERLRGNLERLRLQATVVHGDATRPAGWWDGRPFDRILLDAPCSGSGVIRRHPDIKLLRRPADIEQMAARQQDLLAALWPLLRRGGKLVYATCSVLPRENHQTVVAFLEQQSGARDLTPDLPWGRRVAAGWQTLPGEGGGDGFYYACIDKT